LSARTRAVLASLVAVAAAIGLGSAVLGPSEPGGQRVGASAVEPVDYVALGDSYSAGPLIPLVRNDASGCFRSTNNYPAYLAGLLGVASYRDATCSGARTVDLIRRQRVMLGSVRPMPQASALSAETDLVTVGIGGNDFGLFGSIARGCSSSWRASGAPCRTRFTDGQGRDTKARDARRIRANVEAALAEVRTQAPEADVYVVGYPRLLPETGTCLEAGFSNGDAGWARRIARLLNRSLRLAAEATGATYVDLYPASQGHDICAGPDAWVNGRTVRMGLALSYHPFQVGMREMARVVYEAVTGDEAPPVVGDADPPEGAGVRGR
jgi:lysophospholipase L1-like esterase